MQHLPPYVFGPFVLDRSRRALHRSGTPVVLSSRAFDILRVLIEARDRVVSRAEIVRQVWPGLSIEEHNLSVQVSKLRQALGGASDAVIATIPGRGYQFVAVVEPAADVPAPPGHPAARPPELPPPPSAEAEPAPAAGHIRRRAAASAAAAALLAAIVASAAWPVHTPAPRLSIVVMPFRDFSDRPGHLYLADAITDDLTTDLARLPGSLVIARETADSYGARAVPATQVGRALHVRYLLEGSLRAEADALHVNAQLIDTADGAHLWARRFDVAQGRLDSVRNDIVTRIAAALDHALVRVEAARSQRDRPRDPDALDLFFRARSIIDHDDTLAGFDQAQALLERTVSLQPGFADAQATLGAMLLRKLRSTDDPAKQRDLPEALAAIAAALATQPDHVLALAARAQAELVDERFTDASYSAQTAIALDPNQVDAQEVLAACAEDQGRLDEAAGALEALLRRDPDGAAWRQRALRLGHLRLLQGRLPEAEDWLRRAIAGDPDPGSDTDEWGRAEGTRQDLVAAAALGGRTAQARALYVGFARIWPHVSVWRVAALATRHVAALPGFRRMLDALAEAGMPPHADERADDHVASGTVPLVDTEFGATPLRVPGGTTLDTASMAALVRSDRPKLIIDLGSGATVIPGAVWQEQDSVEDDAQFVDSVVRAHPGAGTPIVLMSDGVYGSTSYNAALRLARRVTRPVLWYRGGEEAWAAAGLPALDLRQ